jgi:hypothetical protein
MVAVPLPGIIRLWAAVFSCGGGGGGGLKSAVALADGGTGGCKSDISAGCETVAGALKTSESICRIDGFTK